MINNVQLVKRKISMKSGSEGPSHDPYSYEEINLLEVFSNGAKKDVTLHMGLAEWFFDGKERKTASDFRDKYRGSYYDEEKGKTYFTIDQEGIELSEKDFYNYVEKMLGMSISMLHTIAEQGYYPPNRCPTCRGKLSSSSGFAGEPLLYCKKGCGIAWSHPDPLRFCE